MKPTALFLSPVCRAAASAKAGLLFSALLLAGCQNGPFAPQHDQHPGISEASAPVALMDAEVQTSVTSAGDRGTLLPDGRLRAQFNLQNRENRPITVQVQCVFKDEQGFSTGDETPWVTYHLTENATEAVEATSTNAQARKYTFRVRQAR